VDPDGPGDVGVFLLRIQIMLETEKSGSLGLDEGKGKNERNLLNAWE